MSSFAPRFASDNALPADHAISVVPFISLMGTGDSIEPFRLYPKDPRYETRARKQAAKRAEIERDRAERIRKEELVLAAVAGCQPTRAIAQQMGLSQRRVQQIYKDARQRAETEDPIEFKEAMNLRLGMLLRSTWAKAMAGDVPAQRQALAVCAEMSKLNDGYPSQRFDFGGEVKVRREVSLEALLEAAAEIQADRILSGEVPVPALVGAIAAASEVVGPSTNGHVS